MSRLLFAYGSLVNAASASITLGRDLEPEAVMRLAGWRRRWSLVRDNETSEKTFARGDGSRPGFCLGLNLEPAPGQPGPNGVLYRVSEAELERLDLREIRYHRVEAGSVVTYVAKPGHFAAEPPDGAVIIAAYLQAVEAAFAGLGEGELEAFRTTTEEPPVEVVEAVLVEDRIPPGNPREW
jgi:cation transport regulator ChaC